jgi:hypothetical protein
MPNSIRDVLDNNAKLNMNDFFLHKARFAKRDKYNIFNEPTEGRFFKPVSLNTISKLKDVLQYLDEGGYSVDVDGDVYSPKSMINILDDSTLNLFATANDKYLVIDFKKEKFDGEELGIRIFELKSGFEDEDESETGEMERRSRD